MPPKCGFLLEFIVNRAPDWLWLEMQETPQNGQNVPGFQVRTPICHIVPVSRAYGGGGGGSYLGGGGLRIWRF